MALSQHVPGFRRTALVLLMVGLGTGTAGTEWTTAVALAVAVVFGERRRLGSLAGPLLALAAALVLSAPLGGRGAWLEVLGRVWPLAPLLAIPALAAPSLSRPAMARIEGLGLVAACVPALWGIAQAIGGEAGRGPFSHHLTLGYALCAPLAIAAHRGRFGVVVVLGAGVASTGGSGPMLSAVAAVLAARLFSPDWTLAGGLLGLLAVLPLGLWIGRSDVHERAVLWTSGAWIALQHPVGTGTGEARAAADVAQAALEPGFHFPLHAHDSALQLASLVGLGGWIALGWLALLLWRRADRAGRAILVALALGSFTQDVLGDMEVARAAAVWVAWSTLELAAEPPSVEHVAYAHTRSER